MRACLTAARPKQRSRPLLHQPSPSLPWFRLCLPLHNTLPLHPSGVLEPLHTSHCARCCGGILSQHFLAVMLAAYPHTVACTSISSRQAAKCYS